jgi:hypothetical protein
VKYRFEALDGPEGAHSPKVGGPRIRTHYAGRVGEPTRTSMLARIDLSEFRATCWGVGEAHRGGIRRENDMSSPTVCLLTVDGSRLSVAVKWRPPDRVFRGAR